MSLKSRSLFIFWSWDPARIIDFFLQYRSPNAMWLMNGQTWRKLHSKHRNRAIIMRTRFWWREPASRKTAPADAVLLSKLIYLRDICSTSHSNLNPGSRILMICCVSRAKMHIWSRKIDESWGFGVFFLVFSFSRFWMVLWWFHYEFRSPGEISCAEMVSDRPGIKFLLKKQFY